MEPPSCGSRRIWPLRRGGDGVARLHSTGGEERASTGRVARAEESCVPGRPAAGVAAAGEGPAAGEIGRPPVGVAARRAAACHVVLDGRRKSRGQEDKVGG